MNPDLVFVPGVKMRWENDPEKALRFLTQLCEEENISLARHFRELLAEQQRQYGKLGWIDVSITDGSIDVRFEHLDAGQYVWVQYVFGYRYTKEYRKGTLKVGAVGTLPFHWDDDDEIVLGAVEWHAKPTSVLDGILDTGKVKS